MALLSDLDIVNAACGLIGAEPLADLAEETIGGQSASLLYESIVDFNLSLEPFEFAHDLRQLSAVAGADPASGWDYVYDVPGPSVGPPRWLTDDATNPDRRFSRYRLLGGRVHASASPLWASVPFRPTPHDWSGAFKMATITAIGARLALSLASDRALHDLLYRQAYGPPSEHCRGGEMRAAISANAQATPPRMANWDNNPLSRAWRS